MKYSEYSVVIVGSGAAGLYAALKVSQQMNLPDGVLLITKSYLGNSNSLYAQGGIVGVLKQNTEDSVECHIEDTLNAGAGLNDREAVGYISEASDEVINDLALCKAVRDDGNIVIMENAFAAELLVSSDKECKGVIVYNELTGEHEIVYTSALVLATGGLGQLYKYTTNPEGATGDGIDLAYNAGAALKDMEFIQFHPTALALNPNSKDRFLISEAVRGEGAKLINNHGDEFMSKYHDKRELAPRDIVTRAIYSEMSKEHTFNVFLNASMIDHTKLFKRFPTISKRCDESGIDISKKPIPVAPAAHYSMGGIKASVEGRTSIKGLYAIGECASTGLHGANRLASNSLLECVVCAYELADYLSFANLSTPKKIDENIRRIIDVYSQPLSDADYDIDKLKSDLKDLMWNNVGIIRSEEDLIFAKGEVEKLKKEFKRTRK